MVTLCLSNDHLYGIMRESLAIICYLYKHPRIFQELQNSIIYLVMCSKLTNCMRKTFVYLGKLTIHFVMYLLLYTMLSV